MIKHECGIFGIYDHDDAARQLVFAPERQHIAYRTNHIQLLSSPSVQAQLLSWLA